MSESFHFRILITTSTLLSAFTSLGIIARSRILHYNTWFLQPSRQLRQRSPLNHSHYHMKYLTRASFNSCWKNLIYAIVWTLWHDHFHNIKTSTTSFRDQNILIITTCCVFISIIHDTSQFIFPPVNHTNSAVNCFACNFVSGQFSLLGPRP